MFEAPSLALARVGSMPNGFAAASYGDDTEVMVEFFKEPVYNEFQSGQQGRAVYDERIFLRMLIPGDKTKQPVRYAQLEFDPSLGTPPDSDRWPRAWAAFQNGEQAVMDGTPLKMWPIIAKHQVDEFTRLGCYTVEQLSKVPDSTLHQMGAGARMLRDMAIDWLAKANDDSALTRMEARHADELSKRDAQVSTMQAQIDALMAKFNADPGNVEEPQRRSPGRPRKEDVE